MYIYIILYIIYIIRVLYLPSSIAHVPWFHCFTTIIPRTMSQAPSYVCIFGAVLRASTPPMGVAAQRSCYLCKQSQMQWKRLAAPSVVLFGL